MRSFFQLALDLFDTTPPPATVARPPPSTQQEPPSAEPAAPLHSMLPPAQFAHPRANRQTWLSNAHVAYEFKRGKRRTIGMQVGPEGLVVSAPRWVSLSAVEAALQEKAGWIVRKLDEMRERGHRMAAAQIDWCDGARFPFLGVSVTLVLDPQQSASGMVGSLKAGAAVLDWQTATELQQLNLANLHDLRLHIGLSPQVSPAQIRDAVQAWLMRQARLLFTQRLDHFASLLHVQWRKLSLSNAGTRWGSARSDGAIRLNWRLIHFKPAVIDYVVAHELSHLRVMDHSPQFWNTVGSVVPDYASLRHQLKDESIPVW